MNISPEDRKKLNDTLITILESSQRSLVSLRKSDFNNLSLDIENLANSITVFMLEAGVELMPGA